MKKIKGIFLIIICVILSIPIITFNWEENVISEIDNRKLTNNPFGKNYMVEENEMIDYTDAIDNYIKDRIGYRDEMITTYTILNDKLFTEMVHPSYEYGKDGHVFFKASRSPEFGDYHIAFANMVEEIQQYCESRDVPFLFVFEPSKATVLQEELKEGINYDDSWIDDFFYELDERKINYVDNTVTMGKKLEDGECVFNKKYNAGHWNDMGAFYGVNAILEKLNDDFPEIDINQKQEFVIEKKLNTSLLVSKFPIHEYEPYFTPKNDIKEKTLQYSDELDINEKFPYFYYSVNEMVKNSPKILVFQGSYMNGMGYKFMQNAFSEYIAVHDYQNVLNIDYYFNIFKPKCVVFEVAEYTLLDTYFSYQKMCEMDLNPPLKDYGSLKAIINSNSEISFSVDKGDVLSRITTCIEDKTSKYVYLQIGDEVFDMKKDDTKGSCNYEVTIENKYLRNQSEIKVIAVSNGVKEVYIAE